MTGPKWPVMVAAFLAVVLLLSVSFAAVKPAQPSNSIAIDPCALVLTRDGHRCR